MVSCAPSVRYKAAAVGKKVFGRKLRLPSAFDKPLKWLKYVVLAVIIGLTWIAGTLVIRPYDPWVAFMHLSSTELWSGFWVGTIILFVSLVASVFYDRFFCKYLCPLGAMYGLISKLGLYRVQRNATKCIDCGRCDKVCPVELLVSKTKDVTSAECLACGICVNACPSQGALSIAGPRNTKISPLFLTLASVGVFAAVIALTSAAGWFATSSKSLGEQVEASYKTQLSSQEAQDNAKFDPGIIKGRNTFAEVLEQTGISRRLFEEKFNLSEEALDKPIKDSLPGRTFTMDDVRNFVAQQLGIVGYKSTEK